MKLRAFRVQMYRSILDSEWVDVDDITVLVGKNESGKTAILKALHKFNPFSPEPYTLDREWPRGYRKERSLDAVVVQTRKAKSQTKLRYSCPIIDVLQALRFPRLTRGNTGISFFPTIWVTSNK